MSGRGYTLYSKEFKEEAVRLYLEGKAGYQKLCEELGIKDTKSLRLWVSKVQRGESLENKERKPLSARDKPYPKTKFASVEEELAYVKAERDYLKKLYRSRFGVEWGAEK